MNDMYVYPLKIIVEDSKSTTCSRGVARRTTRGVLKSHVHGYMVYKIVVTGTNYTIMTFTHCNTWYQHCGLIHAREHHIYICNDSLKTSVPDKLETTTKNTKHA